MSPVYRADFRSTIAETIAPTGDWKFNLGFILALLGSSIWLYYFYSGIGIYPYD